MKREKKKNVIPSLLNDDFIDFIDSSVIASFICIIYFFFIAFLFTFFKPKNRNSKS